MATCKALLISLQDLEINCDLDESVASNKVDIRTQVLQLNYIEPILGEDLFDELLEQVEANTLTALNEALIEEIKPALSWLVYSDLVIYLNVSSTASGMVKSVGESFTLADKEELASISKTAFGHWQTYERRLLRFLEKNKTDYPLWDDKVCYKRGIAGYPISSIGGQQNKIKYLNVHYTSRYSK